MNKFNKITVLEYPRSGGNWMLKILSNCYGIPYRDIDRKCESAYDAFLKKFFGIPPIARFNQVGSILPFRYLLKSHVFYDYDFSRLIYMVRDVRDVMISYYYYYEKEFWNRSQGRPSLVPSDENAIRDDIFRFIVKKFETPSFPGQTWTEHVERALEKQDLIKIVRYEDLLSDSAAVVRGVLGYLGKELSSGRVDRICREQNFDSEKKRLEKIDAGLSSHLRSGGLGVRGELSEQAEEYLMDKCSPALLKLNYTL